MSFRPWLYIFAIGITIATSGQAQEQTGGGQGRTSSQQEPSETPLPPLLAQPLDDRKASDAREAREDESRQREIDDLIAQEGMNAATQSIEKATRDMRDYSFYSTIAVCIGTGLLVVTLLLTWGANRAAVRAAMVSLRSERPWIRFDIEPLDDLFTSPPDMWINYKINFKNVGKSPATINNVFSEYKIGLHPTKVINSEPWSMAVTVFPEDADSAEIRDQFEYAVSSAGATLVICAHYTDLLTNERHWVEREFTLHAGGGPFRFNKEIRLPKDQWGFWDDGKYRVDHE